MPTRIDRCPHDIRIILLAQKNYFRFGGDLPNFLGGSNPIQLWKPDVQQNQVRLQFLRLQNSFDSVGRKANNLQCWIFLELRMDPAAPIGEIIYQKNTNEGWTADGFLQFDVHGQGGEVCALNRLLKEQLGIRDRRCRCPKATLNLSERNQGITNGGHTGRFLTSSHTRCRSRRSCDRAFANSSFVI